MGKAPFNQDITKNVSYSQIYNVYRESPVVFINDPGPLLEAIANDEIKEKWESLHGRAGPFISDLIETGRGGYLMECTNGAILYHYKTGAHYVTSGIYAKFLALGGVSFCGFPTDDVRFAYKPLAGSKIKPAYYCAFQKCYLFSSPKGNFEIHGAIRDRWLDLGGMVSGLGLPTSDETSTAFQTERFNHFEKGSIYWSEQTGAWDVRGAVFDLWEKLGWEMSYVGYPQGPLRSFNDHLIQRFERGSIKLTSDEKAIALPDTVVFRSDPIEASPVRGFLELTLNSEGGWRWRGRVRNQGASGINVIVTTACRWADIEKRLPYWQVETHLEGPPEPNPDRDEDWDWVGISPIIRDNWNRVLEHGVLNRLATNVGVDDILSFIPAAIPWALVGLGVLLMSDGNHKPCAEVGHDYYNPNTSQWEQEKSVIIVPKDQPCP